MYQKKTDNFSQPRFRRCVKNCAIPNVRARTVQYCFLSILPGILKWFLADVYVCVCGGGGELLPLGQSVSVEIAVIFVHAATVPSYSNIIIPRNAFLAAFVSTPNFFNIAACRTLYISIALYLYWYNIGLCVAHLLSIHTHVCSSFTARRRSTNACAHHRYRTDGTARTPLHGSRGRPPLSSSSVRVWRFSEKWE